MVNILFINDKNFTYIETVKKYNESFQKYSSFNIRECSLETFIKNTSLDKEIEKIQLKDFDILLIMYDINYFRLNEIDYSVKKFIRENFFVVFFWQDEYQFTNVKANILKDLSVELCFVNVNEEDAPIIFKNNYTTFKNILTGYIPDIKYEKKNIKDRKIHTFYRATPLPYILGDLGQEKVNIGKYIKKIGLQNNISVDIEWEMDKKIFGEKWYEMLINSKTTLATECGCKVFDWEPRNTEIQNILETRPDYTYEEAKKDFKIEPMFDSCQVSPKMFEAIKLRTVLIMYEGKYRGIFKPNIHYIELKKDHSNIESVIEKIKDDDYLQNMADRAYTDIIENSNYTYKDFIEYFDSVVKEKYEYIKNINEKLNI